MYFEQIEYGILVIDFQRCHAGHELLILYYYTKKYLLHNAFYKLFLKQYAI